MLGLFLTHYDPKKEIILARDPSSYGIEGFIIHKLKVGSIKPTAHTFRTLLPTKKNYSMIEKESLMIVFALKKFHEFIHGRGFILQTDHRPLQAIFGYKKGLSTQTANRSQRWGTILLNHDFKMKFLSSSKLCHADRLSRLTPKNSELL